jgi:hypothetical protein
VPGFDFDGWVERFVTAYNQPESDVKEFFAEEVLWIEMPGGRSGGRQDLFDAFDGVREVLTDLTITEVLRTYAAGPIGILENVWTARRVDGSGNAKSFQSWVWQFDEDGLITMQRDYFMPITDETPIYE